MAKTRVLAVCVSLVAALALAAPAAAADVAKEQAAAAFHAGLAAGAKDVKTVHMHLQHVVNCLVGPAGAGFNGQDMNPCKELGAGILTDTAPGPARMKAETALSHAQAGLKADDLTASQKIAAETQALLK